MELAFNGLWPPSGSHHDVDLVATSAAGHRFGDDRGAAKLINGHQTSRYFAFINFLYIYNKNIHNWISKR
jgi:hypothetical protein